MRYLGWFAVTVALFGLSACSNTEATTKDKDKDSAKPVTVAMETSKGTVEIELYPAKAPVTVKNFLDYANDKFFDGTIFHRVIDGFMIQGGGFEPGLKEKKTKKPIKNEAGNGLSNVRGTIAMARTNDPNSATAQFYISVADNSRGLDKSDTNPGYCVFGKVTKGMDVVDAISKVETNNDVPVKDVIIKSVRVKK
jgi:cyclophilin family peptidyl-prolyl cis-trans isomerase